MWCRALLENFTGTQQVIKFLTLFATWISQDTSTFPCLQAHKSSSDFSYLYFKIHVFLSKSRPSKSYLMLRFSNRNLSFPDFPQQHIHIIKCIQMLQNFSLYVIHYSYLFNNYKTCVLSSGIWFCVFMYMVSKVLEKTDVSLFSVE